MVIFINNHFDGGRDPGPGLTYDIDVVLNFSQYYLNNDANLTTVGEGITNNFSHTITFDSNDTTIRDNANGLNFTQKFSTLNLSDSYVPAEPFNGFVPGEEANYETPYDANSTLQGDTHSQGFKSTNKRLGIHAFLTEHDEFPGSYEISVMISNGYQAAGFIYSDVFTVSVKNLVGFTDNGDPEFYEKYQQVNASYWRPRANLPLKFFLGSDHDRLRNCHHYDIDNTDLVPDKTSLRQWETKCDELVNRFNTFVGGFEQYGWVRPYNMTNKNMGSSPGGYGIAPYYEWRKGAPGYRFWRLEMMGEITRSEVSCYDDTGEPFLVNGAAYIDGKQVVKKQILAEGDPYWGGTTDFGYQLAGFNEQYYGLGAGLNTAGHPDSISALFQYRLIDPDGQSRRFLDDGIFHNWTEFDQAPGYPVESARSFNQTKWTRHAFTHISREYRAADALSRKDPFARYWMKVSYWNMRQWRNQTAFNASGNGLISSLDQIVAATLSDPNERGQGTGWGDRGFIQPARLVSKQYKLNTEIDTASRLVSQTIVSEDLAVISNAVDVVMTDYGIAHRRTEGQELALYGCWVVNSGYGENFDTGNWNNNVNSNYQDIKPNIRLSRGFQAQLFSSLLNDVSQGISGNVGSDSLSVIETSKTVTERITGAFERYKEKFPRDSKMFNWFEPDYIDNYTTIRDLKKDAPSTLEPLHYFGSLVPADEDVYTSHPSYWATKGVLMRCLDFPSPNQSEPVVGYFGGSGDTEFTDYLPGEGPGNGIPVYECEGSLYSGYTIDDGEGSQGPNNVVFNSTDGKDRYYHGITYNALFLDKTLISDFGKDIEDVNFSGYSDDLGWLAGDGSDVWNLFLDSKIYATDNQIPSHEYLDSVPPTGYANRLIPVSGA